MAKKKELTYIEARNERRQLKQKLFKIRRHEEGEDIELDDELLQLKEHYESKDKFVSWSSFPEKWDIGDPNGVKKQAFTFNDVDQENINKIQDKGYDDIVLLTEQPNKKVVVEKAGKKITYTDTKN